MRSKIKKIKNIVTIVNGDYDPDRCHNGGGYYQPRTKVEFADQSQLVIDDLSCGEFGSRIYAVYKTAEGTENHAVFGSMLEPWNVYSDFNESHASILTDIEEKTGYHIPLRKDIDEEIDFYKENGWR